VLRSIWIRLETKNLRSFSGSVSVAISLTRCVHVLAEFLDLVKRVVRFFSALQSASLWVTRPLVQAGVMPALFDIYGQLCSDAFGSAASKTPALTARKNRQRDHPEASPLPGSVNQTGGAIRRGNRGELRSGDWTEANVESPSLADAEKANLSFRTVREMQGAALGVLRLQVLGGLLALLTRGRCPLVVEDGVVEGWMRSLVNGLDRYVSVAEQGRSASISGKKTGGCIAEAGGRATGSVLGCTDLTIKVVKRLEELGVSASEALWKEVDTRLRAALGAFTSAESRLCQDRITKIVAEAETVLSPENTEERGDRFRGEAPGEKTAGMQEALAGAPAVQELGNLFRIVRDLCCCTGGALGTATEMVERCGAKLISAGRLLAGAVRHSGETGPPKGVASPSRRPDSDLAVFAMREVVGPYVNVLVRLMDLVSLSAQVKDRPPSRPLRSRAEEARERPVESQPGQRLRLAEASSFEGGAPTAPPISAKGGLNNHAGESEPEMSRKSVAFLTAFLLEALGRGREEESGASPWGSAVGQAPGGLSTGPLERRGSVAELVPLAVGWLVEDGKGEGIGDRGGEQNGWDDVQKAAKIVSSVRVFFQVLWSVNTALQRREGLLWAVLGPWMDPVNGAALKILQREENDRLQKEVLHLVEFAFGLGTDSKAAGQDGAPSKTEAQGTAVGANGSEPLNPFHITAYTDAFLEYHVSAAARLLTSAAPEPIESARVPTSAEALKLPEPSEPPLLASKAPVIALGKPAPLCSEVEPARKAEPQGSEKCLSQSELCTLHLRVITAIARGKSPGAIARLYQLGLMGRLVEQIGLEYESTLLAFPSPLSRAHSSLGNAVLGVHVATNLDNGGGQERINASLDTLRPSVSGSAGEDARAGVLYDKEKGAVKTGQGTRSEEIGIGNDGVKRGSGLDGSVETASSTRADTHGGSSGRSGTPLVPRLRLGTLQALGTAVKPLSPGKLTAVKPVSPEKLPAVKPIGLLSPSRNSATDSSRLSISDKENVSHRSGDSDCSGGVRAAFSMPKLALSKLPANRGARDQKSPFQGGLSPGKSGGVQMSAWSSRLYAKDPSRKHLLSPVSPIPSVPELPAESESKSGKALSARLGSRSREPSMKSRTARASVPERGAVSTSKEVLSAHGRMVPSPRKGSGKDMWRDLNDEVDRQMGEEGARNSDTSESESDASEIREEASCSDSDREEELRLPEVPLRHSDVISLGGDVSVRREDVIGGAARAVSMESSCSHVWDDDGKESSWESRAMGSGRTVSQLGTAHEAADGGSRIVAVRSEPTKQSEPFMARVEREALGLMQKGSGGGVGASENGARGGEASESKSAGLTVAVRPVPRLRLPLAARKDQTHKEAHHAKTLNGWTGLTKLVNEDANPVSDGVSASSSLPGSGREKAPAVPGLGFNPEGLISPLGKVPGLKLPTSENYVSLGQQSENADREQKSGQKAGRETDRVAAHYQARRSSALMYSDQRLHVAVLELIFCMMTTAE
jgi:hypothetical protein